MLEATLPCKMQLTAARPSRVRGVFATQTLITFVKCDPRDSGPHSGNQWGRLKDGVMSAHRVESGRRTAGISYIYTPPPRNREGR